MNREEIEKIFDEVDSKWEGDNAFQGLQILSKYTDNLITGANHDIIYSEDIDKIVEKITEEDAIALAKLNWMINDEGDCLACFV